MGLQEKPFDPILSLHFSYVEHSYDSWSSNSYLVTWGWKPYDRKEPGIEFKGDYHSTDFMELSYLPWTLTSDPYMVPI